ncbi:MAG: alpha-glucan family phosphorylase [Polyangiaceae bacterium]|nr:alpha-glucan family phosphorylase [Polyangiaceae bacterium]
MFSFTPIRVRRFESVPALPEPLVPLLEIANNLGWSWHHESVDLFARIDPKLWHATKHNPLMLLRRCSQTRLEQLATDESYLFLLQTVQRHLTEHHPSPGWFEARHPSASDATIAYFCAEFGLAECFRNYSGGLGILAGDHLKSSSGLGVPLTGVGLLYSRGYTQQEIDKSGFQQDYSPDLDLYNLPLRRIIAEDESQVVVSVEFPGREVKLGLWELLVGRVRLILLDANLPENSQEDREITSQLYGGDQVTRIKQELVLGVGGRRALARLGITPSVRHMNEGHAAFQALEQIRMSIEADDLSFQEALVANAAGNLFTTHTPVPAGIDRFPNELAREYLAPLAPGLRVEVEDLLRLGHVKPDDAHEEFSMAVLALHTSQRANGVARLHGRVSRAMWSELWPQTPVQDVPIGHVTNGVHLMSWIGVDLAELLDRYLPPRWRSHPEEHEVWSGVEQIPEEELWRVHDTRRHRLVRYLRGLYEDRVKRNGETLNSPPPEEVFDPNALTIGFARRFATYKRADLVFSNAERLKRLLSDAERPVQLVFAGKAHPADLAGKELIQKIIQFARENGLERRVFFAENYDMEVARHLVQGVDLWLNTPRRPMEASGTSGMKAAINGVLNCSISDGWWDERPSAAVGWTIGNGEEYSDRDYQDRIESERLYDVLEHQVVPTFYKRENDVPEEWVRMMKHSIRELAPRFNSHRMLQDYSDQYYVPAHLHAQRLAADGFKAGRALCEYLNTVRANWPAVRIEEVQAETQSPIHVQRPLSVAAQVTLPEAITPQMVKVQACFGPIDNRGEIANIAAVDLTLEQELTGGRYRYVCELSVEQTGVHGFALRVLPDHPDLAQSFVPGLVVWEPAGSPGE